MEENPVTLRLPQPYLDRAQDLVHFLAEDPEIMATAGRSVSRSTVLRLAVVRGLEVLEGKYTEKPGKKRPEPVRR